MSVRAALPGALTLSNPGICSAAFFDFLKSVSNKDSTSSLDNVLFQDAGKGPLPMKCPTPTDHPFASG